MMRFNRLDKRDDEMSLHGMILGKWSGEEEEKLGKPVKHYEMKSKTFSIESTGISWH